MAADRDLGMDAWMNRYRSFAEGVVVMVSPVLLAFALSKVKLTREEYGHVVPIIMLVVAAATLIAGICPFIVCSFSKCWASPSENPQSPHSVTKWLASTSSMCLLALTWWIMSLIIDRKLAYSAPVALCGLCVMIRSVMYCCGSDAQEEGPEYYSRLENSLDYLAGITALMFLGLEGLALEGHTNRHNEGIQRHLIGPMTASLVVCVIGVLLTLLATIPPRSSNRYLPVAFDCVMGSAVSIALFFMVYPLIKLRALIFVTVPGFLILMVYAYNVCVLSNESGNNHNQQRQPTSPPVLPLQQQPPPMAAEPAQPASLELTKVAFAGFLAVSIPRVTEGSVYWSTELFMHLAAAAIVSGLIWRLLTHLKSDDKVKATVNVVSIVTYSFVLVATIPFVIMAGKALGSTGDDGCAAASPAA